MIGVAKRFKDKEAQVTYDPDMYVIHCANGNLLYKKGQNCNPQFHVPPIQMGTNIGVLLDMELG